ncbi:Ig-like domain-containing protein [Clostridium perfringens]|uniref:Ig-like domain-containing protein n=1 Tax=Clostridium perfringens TaxID=1502 RepID=UPI00244BEC91|nr:Ig-like domain-containing protein [Clostridium perfringens]MDH2338724.1 Ig-like domain-containing protein [Clostridium perfringens]
MSNKNKEIVMPTWRDKQTPVNAANLNSMVQSIKQNSNDIEILSQAMTLLNESKLDKVELQENVLKFYAKEVEKFSITIPTGSGGSGIPGQDGRDGREIELRKGETHIEWNYVGEDNWKQLVSLEELKGPKGQDGESPTLEIGDVSTLEPSSRATASVRLISQNRYAIDLGIPRGAKGQDGTGGGSGLIIRDMNPGEIFTINSNVIDRPVVPVQSITLNQTNLSLKKGNTYKLEVTILPSEATDKTLNWSSSRDEIATVKNGEVTAIEEGVCDIIVSSNSGDVSAKCKVTVEANNEIVNVNTISLNKKTHTMKVDETVNLTFTIDPPNATNQTVTWEANNQNCIVENGLVTAKTKGECIITVRTQEGNKTDTCTITIEEKEAVEPVEFTNCLYNTDTFNSPSHSGTYWQNYKCTKNVQSGIATLLFNTPNAGFFLCRPDIADNNKYYYRLLVRTSDIPHLKVTKSGVTLEGKNLGDWTLFSVVDVDKSTTTTLRIEDTRQEGFTEIKTKEWMKINLTEIYGSGNEPTKEKCDSVFTVYKTGLTG